jgi:CRISPR-associated protein Cas1
MEWVQGEFAYNADVLEGKYQHRNVDVKSGTKKLEQDTDEKIHARSVTLSDEGLGLVAKMDLLELEGSTATPIEYKRGSTPKNPDKLYDDHIIQVCAQGLLLRANGYTCTKGIVYYISSKQRIDVNMDDKTVSKTLEMIKEMRAMAKADVLPPPLVDSPKCPRCSLVGICLPDETNLLAEESPKINKDQVRRMYPVRNDSVPLYLQEQGATISKSGECIHVKMKGEVIKKIRLIDVSEVVVFGNVQVTAQALREMCIRNIPVCYMTYGGWFTGMTTGLSHKNVELRICQYEKHGMKSASMAIAREIVFAKIKNCITMLRRNHKSPPKGKIAEMDRFAEQAHVARKYDVLLGIEGMAARVYFSEFNGMIKSESMYFEFEGRSRRPPMDPVNAIMSFLYSMLTRQAMTTASMVGLDPHLGYLHRPKYGKPALALDLIEEFRPIVADSVCITLINNGEITPSDVIKTNFGVNLTSGGRRTVISAYERRMDSTVTHPILGYPASYRRIMETQARLLSRHIMGEIPSYPAFRTR